MSAHPKSSVLPLFRKEAIAARRGRGAETELEPGRDLAQSLPPLAVPLQGPPPTQKLVLSALTLFVLLGGLLLGGRTYTQKLSVSGYTQTGAGITRVYPPRVAIVETLLVDEGQWVQAGDVLLTLATREHLGNTTLDAMDQAALQQELSELDLQQSLVQRQANRSRHSFAARIAQTEAGLPLLREQAEVVAQRTGLALTHLRAVTRLHETKVASERQLAAAQTEHLSLVGEQTALKQQHNAQALNLLHLRAQADEVAGQSMMRLSNLRAQRSEMQRALTRLAVQVRNEVVAPVAGQVSLLQATPGRRVVPSRPLLNLNAAQQDPQVVLLLPSPTATKVRAGQQVSLRYAGLPLQETARQWGTIETLSATPVHPGDLEVPLSLSGPSFRAQVSVRSVVPAQLQIIPGMLVNADIELQAAPLWRWFFKPFAAAWDRF